MRKWVARSHPSKALASADRQHCRLSLGWTKSTSVRERAIVENWGTLETADEELERAVGWALVYDKLLVLPKWMSAHLAGPGGPDQGRSTRKPSESRRFAA